MLVLLSVFLHPNRLLVLRQTLQPSNPTDKFCAIETGMYQIGNYKGIRTLPKHLKGFGPVCRGINFETGFGENMRHNFTNARFIIYE